MTNKQLNIHYASIHGTYWMYYGVVGGFASVFLLAKGYSNSEIGLILALANMIAIIVQPFLAEWADRGSKTTLFGIIEGITVINLILSTLMIFQAERSAILTTIFVLCYALMMANQPFINSVNRRLEEAGNRIAFGTCRSIGSLAYAVLVFFLGTVVEHFGTESLPPIGDAVLILIMLTTFLTYRVYRKNIYNHQSHRISAQPAEYQPTATQTADQPLVASEQAVKTTDHQPTPALHEADQPPVATEHAAQSTDHQPSTEDTEMITLGQFIASNKLFFVMSLGIMGIFFANTVPNAYMAQIVDPIGGGSDDVGRILAALAVTEIPTLILFDKLYQRFTTVGMLKLASFAYVLWMLAMLLSRSVGMMLLSQILHLFSFPLFLPAMVRFIDDNMRSGEAVKGQTLFTVMITMGNLTASLAGGVILDLAGANALLITGTVAAAVGTMVILLTINRTNRATQHK